MDKDTVRWKLGFAENRLSELLQELNGAQDRRPIEQLMQEFFFHLVGATELVAQLANERYGLGLDPDQVRVPDVVQRRVSINEGSDEVDTVLGFLYQNPAKWRFTKGDYSDATYIVRLINYRHQVSHRYLNPLEITVPRDVRLYVDPRHVGEDGASDRPVDEELRRMHGLVRERINRLLDLMPGA